MLNKDLLKSKYKDFILENKEKFVEEVNFLKSKINLEKLTNEPLLIYSQNKRNALYYVLSLYYSLKEDRMLTYAVITGQTLINQHFASEQQRDAELYNSVYYADISFISLSQYDYTSEYLESQIIDLISFRKQNKKLTIISYDIMSSNQNYINLTKKLHAFFLANDYQILDLAKTGKTVFDKEDKKDNTVAKAEKRII
jgi:hypothetical protein